MPGSRMHWSSGGTAITQSRFFLREITGKERPVSGTIDDFSRYDSDSAIQTYVRTRTDGMSEASLLLEEVHCAACVWLIEKYLQRVDGILEVRLNIASQRMRVIWDRSRLPIFPHFPDA